MTFFRKPEIIIALTAAVLSAAVTAWAYLSGYILAYGDAESHVNIAKRVVDGMTPGFGQLGGVWLPLQHILMIPFVANDFMWRTGLGGSLVSMVSYVIGAVYVYKLANLLLQKRWVVYVVTAIFMLNPNVLYMQAIPMSETLLLTLLVASTYYFVRWVGTQGAGYLILAAALAFAGSLVRYDAWFLIAMQALGVVVIGLANRWRYKKIEGLAILYLTPALLGVVLWLAWNLLIFGDPLYFLSSPYSAQSQQQAFAARGELPADGNLLEALNYYSGAVIVNVGIFMAMLALFGLACMLADKKGRQLVETLVVAGVLLAPFIFNVVSLYLGISILFIPNITPENFEFNLFNVRYGLMMVPAVAIFVGYLLLYWRGRAPRLAMGAVTSLALLYVFISPPITLLDGTEGLSARRPGDVNAVLVKQYDYGFIAFDDFSRSATPTDLKVPMDKIIYVGAHPYWDNMLDTPSLYARWIVIRKDDELSKALLNNDDFKRNYRSVYAQTDVQLYKCICSSPDTLNQLRAVAGN